MVVIFALLAFTQRWTHDDGFIVFRVVDQIFAGHGPVFNQGQRVEVVTGPGFLWLLVVVRLLSFGLVDIAWLAVILGIAGGTIGLYCAALGAQKLFTKGDSKTIFVPFGLLVALALRPIWEYQTAGLEMGLACGWVGIAFKLLADLAAAEPLNQTEDSGEQNRSSLKIKRLGWICVFLGLGPLLRPELALHSVIFLLLVASFEVAKPLKIWKLFVGWAAIPFTYQIFRMGYYASLVPNTALAKSAIGSRWGQGWFYFKNTFVPYALWVPLIAGMAVVVLATLSAQKSTNTNRFLFINRDGRNLAAAMTLSGILYGIYVLRVGGDYMHARMWIIPIFTLICPLAVLPIATESWKTRWSFARLGLVGLVAVWAVTMAFVGGAPEPRWGSRGVGAQREFVVEMTGNQHPVTMHDWKGAYLYRDGMATRRANEVGKDLLWNFNAEKPNDQPRSLPLPKGSGMVLYLPGIGMMGYSAGIEIPLIDYFGLADPIASRMNIDALILLPGHERRLPIIWAQAEAGVKPGDSTDPEAVTQATEALRCGDIGDLMASVNGPLSPGRFLKNILQSPKNTTLSISAEPSVALASC